jgi:hypothetical protein
MMRHLRCLLAFGVAGLAASCGSAGGVRTPRVVPPPVETNSRPILSLQEVRNGGGDRTLEANMGAVDINSTVLVTLDRTALRERAVGAAVPTQVIQDLSRISRVLEGLTAKLTLHQTALATLAAAPEDPQALNAAISTASDLASPLLGIGELALQRPALMSILTRRRAANRQDTSIPTSIADARARAEAATEYMILLQSQVDSVARQNGVRVRLGAFLVRANGGEVPLHLRGFDSIAPQQTLIIPQYQLFLSQAQIQELNRAQQAARDYRAAIAAGQNITPVTVVREYARSLFRQDLQCVDQLRQQVNTFPAGLQQPRDAVVLAAESFVRRWDELRTRYTQTESADLLVGVQAELRDLQERGSALLNAWAELRRAAQATGAGALATIDALQGCATTLQSNVVQGIRQVLDGNGLADAGTALANATLDFSDKVLSLDLASVPASTEFSLTQAGPRDPGDQVVLRLVTSRGNAEQYSERRSVPIQRIVPHLKLAVSMIWMERGQLPDDDESGRWHPAASYSIVAKRFMPWEKGWARRSGFYAQVFDPGLGINLSAPDFDHDDTPEFAVGPVVSVFRDYLQGGYSYNFQESQWTWFVGIRLPIPSATIPVVESGGQQ